MGRAVAGRASFFCPVWSDRSCMRIVSLWPSDIVSHNGPARARNLRICSLTVLSLQRPRCHSRCQCHRSPAKNAGVGLSNSLTSDQSLAGKARNGGRDTAPRPHLRRFLDGGTHRAGPNCRRTAENHQAIVPSGEGFPQFSLVLQGYH